MKEINIYSLKFPLRCEGEGSSISMFGERMEGNTHSMFFFFFFHIGKIVDYSISLKCISNLDSQAKNRKSMYYELDAKKKISLAMTKLLNNVRRHYNKGNYERMK